MILADWTSPTDVAMAMRMLKEDFGLWVVLFVVLGLVAWVIRGIMVARVKKEVD